MIAKTKRNRRASAKEGMRCVREDLDGLAAQCGIELSGPERALAISHMSELEVLPEPASTASLIGFILFLRDRYGVDVTDQIPNAYTSGYAMLPWLGETSA